MAASRAIPKTVLMRAFLLSCTHFRHCRTKCTGLRLWSKKRADGSCNVHAGLEDGGNDISFAARRHLGA